jgi:hypothetical protein
MALALVVVVSGLGPGGCGGSQPLVTNCGWVYTLKAPSGETRIGACSGSLRDSNPDQLAIHKGQTFQLVSEGMALPRPDNAKVVVLVRTHGLVGEYRAVALGTATLTTTTYCGGYTVPPRPFVRVCPVVAVQVSR